MISLADFQPLFTAKINVFHRQPRFYRQIYHSVKVHSILRGPLYKLRFVDTLRDSASFRRLTSLIELEYFHL